METKTQWREHKLMRLTPTAREQLLEVSAAYQQRPVYMLAEIIDAFYKVWKEETDAK